MSGSSHNAEKLATAGSESPEPDLPDLPSADTTQTQLATRFLHVVRAASKISAEVPFCDPRVARSRSVRPPTLRQADTM